MTLALVIYLCAIPSLPPDELHQAIATGTEHAPLTRSEWRGILALLVLFIPTALFWAVYEQQGNTIALWADDHTDRFINLLVWRGEIPVHLVPGLQPIPDLRLRPSSSRCGRARPRAARALDGLQDGARLLRRGAGEPDHDRRGLGGRRRRSQLAVAAGLFRRRHRRRALPPIGLSLVSKVAQRAWCRC